MAEDGFVTVDREPDPSTSEQNTNTEFTPAIFHPTKEWVEQELLPLLRELSRNGTICIFDAGVEPLSRGV